MIFTSILILIVAKALPSINKNLSPIYFTRISAIIFVYAGVLSLNTFYIQSIGSGIGIYSGLFQITQVSILIEIFLLLIGSLILIAVTGPSINQFISSNFNNFINSTATATAATSLNSITKHSKDYSLIVLFSTLGSCLLISSFDLISLYISIELQSFGVYILSTLYRDSESSTKAGLKYFLLGALSSSIILLGCGIIYSYTGLTNFESIYSVISTSNSVLYLSELLSNTSVSLNYIVQGLSLGLMLIVIGFLFKIAAAPLHNWSPDVYDEVPTVVTIWLTIMPKISILILLLELQYYGFTLITSDMELTTSISNIFNMAATAEGWAAPAEVYDSSSSGAAAAVATSGVYATGTILESSNSILKNLLLISSLLSLIIGTVVGLAQTRIKRLLA